MRCRWYTFLIVALMNQYYLRHTVMILCCFFRRRQIGLMRQILSRLCRTMQDLYLSKYWGHLNHLSVGWGRRQVNWRGLPITDVAL